MVFRGYASIKGTTRIFIEQSMSIDKLYDLLEKKDFLNPDTANIFSPFYFYTYDAKNEYSTRQEIERLKGKLERPLAMVDTLVLNLYDVMVEYLKCSTVAGKSQFDRVAGGNAPGPVSGIGPEGATGAGPVRAMVARQAK